MSGSPSFHCPAAREPVDDLADLECGHRGLVIAGAQTDRVQHRRPRGAAHLQRGDEGVRPAGDELRGALGPPVHVAEQSIR